MTSPRKAKCDHALRSSQAVNYITEGKLCLLPLEAMTCLACWKTFILDAVNNQIVPHPTKGSRLILETFMAAADKERNKPSIIVPSEKQIIS